MGEKNNASPLYFLLLSGLRSVLGGGDVPTAAIPRKKLCLNRKRKLRLRQGGGFDEIPHSKHFKCQ